MPQLDFMDFLFSLLVLVALGFLAVPIVALVMLVRARASIRNLEWETADLKSQLRALEADLQNLKSTSAADSAPKPSPPQLVSVATPPAAQASHAVPPVQAAAPPPATPAPQPAPPPEPPPPPVAWTPAPAAQQPSILFQTAPLRHSTPPHAARSSAARIFSLEERLGANWLNKLGVAILVIGLAFFLAYKLQTMGPAGKVLCGFSVSLALLLGGVWLERKPTYRIFARAGIGGGWALLYFTTFAMHHIAAARILNSLVADLVLMLLVAAGMVLHSLRYRSQTVTGLAFLLGYATLLTSHLQAAGGTVVFSLSASAILAVALVVVTARRHWAILELAGLAAVYITHFVWLTQILPPNHADFREFWPSTLLILLYWAIFRCAYVLRTPLSDKEESLSSLAAVLNSAGVLALLKTQSARPELAFLALAILGAAEMLLAFRMRTRRRQAFVVLSTIASILLVAAVPYRFHGVSWPVLWLVEAQVLALSGLRLREAIFRRLGLLVGLATGCVLAFRDVLPLWFFRLDQHDQSHHPSLTVGLALAALLYWLHAELYPRRWPNITDNEPEDAALRLTSWLAAAAAAAALWVVLPVTWVAVGLIAFVVLLGFVADRISAVSLALQSDALALCGILAVLFLTLDSADNWPYHRIPALLTVALLYVAMRRRTVPAGAHHYVPIAYSWAAAFMLPILAFDIIQNAWIVVVLSALALALFEAGHHFRAGFLRGQAYFLTGLAFAYYFLEELPRESGPITAASHFSLVQSALLETLILLVLGYWLAERTRARDDASIFFERYVTYAAASLATLALLAWFAVRFPSFWVPVPGAAPWVTPIWASLATLFLALASILGRRALAAQAILVALLVDLRAFTIDLSGADATFWHDPLFPLSVASLLLLAVLPFAFRIRAAAAPQCRASLPITGALQGALNRPEQWFFFTPFALMVVALAVRLHGGHITIAWSLFGLAVFLFALAVGQRSYRLAGLSLLLLSVVKILLMDVWALGPSDRYTTLIILGLALLAVSFLYTRFRALIQKYL